MVILWWLAPPAVATVVAMLWVSWLGRAGRGEVDREVAVRRLGAAMAKPSRVSPPSGATRRQVPGERSTGVAVRPSSRQAHPPVRGRSTHDSTPTDAPGDSATRRAS